MTLDEMLAHPIVGNHYSDGPLLSELDTYAKDPTNTINNRARAIHHIDVVMGLEESDLRPKDLVVQFMENARENGEL